MALPTILPAIIMDRTDRLIMLDRTGGTGTGPVAIGGTIDFRAVDKSRAQSVHRGANRSVSRHPEVGQETQDQRCPGNQGTNARRRAAGARVPCPRDRRFRKKRSLST
jgi:hypothetical protein